MNQTSQTQSYQDDQIIHFDVVTPPNPIIRSPRLTYPEQLIFLKKEMEIADLPQVDTDSVNDIDKRKGTEQTKF